MKRRLVSTFILIFAFCTSGFAQEIYKKPQPAVLDVLNAPLPPDATVNPTKLFAMLTIAQRYPPIADVAAPMLRLPGEGEGASPQGDLPFLDRFNLRTGQTKRIIRSTQATYETFAALLGPDGSHFAYAGRSAELLRPVPIGLPR